MNPIILDKIINKITNNPENLKTIDELEALYPPRKNSDGETITVTRFAPSPTGFMHIGGIYASIIAKKIADQANGKFVLRIEDTDRKREVEGAVDIVIKGLENFDITPDEGVTSKGVFGEYGPYKQSQREDIYNSCIKHLLEQDLAYPCFCTPEDLEKQRTAQMSLKQPIGYHTKWAKCSRLTDEEVIEKLDSDTPFVIRFRSSGDKDKKFEIKDLIKGKLSFPQNDDHVVIFKRDGLPTYHFAHVVDDHFMRTTHATRGDEWIPSLATHIQLFAAMGWKIPKYGHFSPILKLEDGNKRKISKRKDPEANVKFYMEQGYPKQAVKDYLMNLINASFEDWRKANPTASLEEYKLDFSTMKKSAGALLDFNKLDNISKNFIATLSATQVFESVEIWAKENNEKLFNLMQKNPEYITNIFGIERTGTDKVRKDYAKWADVESSISFFFNEGFENSLDKISQEVDNVEKETIKDIITSYAENYNPNLTKEEWFEDLKQQAANFAFAANKKEQLAEPEKYIGNIADFSKILRCAVTGLPQSPDLHQVMQVMGADMVKARMLDSVK
jgi:glutamyl-tRNA synthetase